ncbi:MAG TPA: nicotinate-nucleotide adenylyltransferase, partial [Flavobacterium sp.]|nr:nicotinate-nucleotide adenylyltransferase [Flavobacterium sp.]
KFFAYNGKVVDIENYEKKDLKIFSREVLKKICINEPGWEDSLPEGVPELIKKDKLFGY